MVYLYSTISGFKAVLGSVAIQAAMLLCLLLFVEVPQQSFQTPPNDSANSEMEHNLKSLWHQMVFTHFFAVLAIELVQFAPSVYFKHV